MDTECTDVVYRWERGGKFEEPLLPPRLNIGDVLRRRQEIDKDGLVSEEWTVIRKEGEDEK